MKIKDLIKDLQKLDPNGDLVFSCSIEHGMSVSICEREAELDITTLQEAESKRDPVYEISIEGEETSFF